MYKWSENATGKKINIRYARRRRKEPIPAFISRKSPRYTAAFFINDIPVKAVNVLCHPRPCLTFPSRVRWPAFTYSAPFKKLSRPTNPDRARRAISRGAHGAYARASFNWSTLGIRVLNFYVNPTRYYMFNNSIRNWWERNSKFPFPRHAPHALFRSTGSTKRVEKNHKF